MLNFGSIHVKNIYALFISTHPTPDGVKGLQGGEVAPGPAKLHGRRVTETRRSVGEMDLIRFEALIG